MSEVAPAPAFGSWSLTGIPLSIEYSLDLMEQIRGAAQKGRKLAHGGREVGGVLFGDRMDKTIRLRAWRPIACEYTRGPAFVLSSDDRGRLAKLLNDAAGDSELTGLYPLGWFVSHIKSGLELTSSDLKVFQTYFPADCQTTLVLHPEADGSARACFFLRDHGGKVQRAKKAQEFTIAPDKILPESPEETGAGEADETSNGPAPERAEPPRVPAKPPDARAAAQRKSFDGRAGIWLVPAVLVLAIAAMMWQRTRGPRPTPSFSLRANDVGGDLRFEWDRNAEPIREASRATLDIKDGQTAVPLTLDANRLHDGYFNYARLSGDVELRMTVYPVKGAPVTEFAKFLGPPVTPVVKTDQLEQITRERDRLQADLADARESLKKQTARNRQLENTVQILERRVQVQKLLVPKP